MENYGVVYGLHGGDGSYRYVGQSVKPSDRLASHRRAARNGSSYYVHRWMNSVGVENVVMEILDYAPDAEMLNALEVAWMARLTGEGFHLTNLNAGGGGQSGLTGERSAGSKLTLEQVGEIVQLLIKTSMSCEEIAAAYGVTGGNIQAIARGDTWPDLERPVGLRGVDRVSREAAKSAVSELSKGRTVSDVSRMLSLPHGTVGRIARGTAFSDLERPEGFYGKRRRAKKLTETDVIRIRELLHSGVPQGKIAVDFDVSVVTVRNIKRGKTWSHIADPYDLAQHDGRSGRLTDDEVRAVRARVIGGERPSEVGADYGLNTTQVWQIRHRKTYAKVED